MTLPNFLVIGAQRAGTTLLHRMLAAHPEVFVPDRRKEIHYFDRYFDRGVEWYQEFFPPSGSVSRYRAIGEVTPDYLFEREAPRRIHDLLPDCRLIVSLRNPVDRAYSAYLYARRSYNEKRDLEGFLLARQETIQRGFYSEQLERYMGIFPRHAFLFIIYEELVAEPESQLARIADFLQLDRGWSDPGALMRERVNASEAPRLGAAFAQARRLGALLTRNDLDWIVTLAKRSGVLKLFGRARAPRPLPAPGRRLLENVYRDEIAALEAILGRDVQAWGGRQRCPRAPTMAVPSRPAPSQ